MGEHELLLRHAERWAAEHDRGFDRSLVELVLDLRSTHDGLAANLWPAGSCSDLMLQRWPSHGPVEAPDLDLLLDSLDTFWRFLRSTGRMAGASAEPAQLRKEARKAAKQMPEACADTSRYGVAKSMMGFGSEIGLSLDDVDSIDAANARLQQIVEAWNALPIEERRRRSGDEVTLPGLFGGQDGDVDLDASKPNDPSVSAPFARSSPFVAKVLELAAWVGQGREVTATQLLRPAVGREAYAALDLWSWELSHDPYLAEAATDPAFDMERYRASALQWRSSGDCFALDRLWYPALMTHLVTVHGRKAVHDPSSVPSSDADWVLLTLELLMFLTLRSVAATGVAALVHLLARLEPDLGGGPHTLVELQDQWWESPANERADHLAQHPWGREVSDLQLAGCVEQFEDCGLWTRQGDRLVATALCWDFLLVLISALDTGLLDVED